MHPRSETEIFGSLDSVCSEVGRRASCMQMSLADTFGRNGTKFEGSHVLQIVAASSGKASWFAEPCKALIIQHRSTLENHIFSEGVEDLRRFLCNELTDLCRQHQLHDSGEL